MMGFAIVIVFWASIYAVDLFLKSNHATQERYLVWNINTGISLGLLKIKWFTKYFNRYFQNLGNITWFPWTIWFNCGIVLSWLTMVLGTILLSLLVYNTFNQKVVEHEVLSPVLPGINVPFSHIGFLISSIVIAGVVHEVGHAMSALKEGVRVDGFGLIFFIVYPGAFTNINTCDLESLDCKRKLRIFSAGNWHNFVTLIISLILSACLPIFLMPFYRTGEGVAVNFISQNSVLSGKLGLHYGDVITKINNCPVYSQTDWFNCMYFVQQHPQQSFKQKTVTALPIKSIIKVPLLSPSPTIHSGYCMPLSKIKQLDISEGYQTTTIWGNIDCCSNETRSHLCFKFSAANYRFSIQPKMRYACLPVRTVTERNPCSVNANCFPQSIRPDLTCVMPSLENTSRLLRLVHTRSVPVLFLGNVNDLLQTVAVSNYVPRWTLVPYSAPFLLENFLSYLVAISGALILFNSVPCYALDGQWILQSTVEMWLASQIRSRVIRQKITTMVTWFGTILIVTNISLSIYFMIKQLV